MNRSVIQSRNWGGRFSVVLAWLLMVVLPASAAQAATRGIALQPAATVSKTPYVNGVYRALVIGNQRYQDPQGKWISLETAVSGANEVAALLKDHYGFGDVTVLHNATRRDILQALDTLSKRVMPRDSVLIYYAGHGWVDLETSRGYWIPVDAVGTDHTTFLRNSTIRDELNTIANRSQHTLLISDSCFSGTLLRTASRGIQPDYSDERFYQSVAQKKSVQILAAGGVEFVDDNYRESGHSPFTYFLLNELRLNNRPIISASELSANVRRAVANNADQTPEAGVLQGAGDEMGEFLFMNINININLSTDGTPTGTVEVEMAPQPAAQPAPAAAEPEPVVPAKSRPVPLPTL